MQIKPLILLASARKESDTLKLVESIFRENEAELIDLLDYKIYPYNYEEQYPNDDQFISLFDTILKHHKIIFATPVYWYSMSGPMKIFFDRLTDITGSGKEIGKQLKGKEIFLLAVGTDPLIPEGFEIPFQLTSKYFDMNFISTYYCRSNRIQEMNAEKQAFIQKIKQ